MARHLVNVIERAAADSFENADVTITMKGAEWFALTAKAAGKPLSEIGREIANSAGLKLCDQLMAASDKMSKVPPVGPGGSVECPHCHWGFAPSAIDQHIREKHR